MDKVQKSKIIEAVLFAATKPLTIEKIAAVFYTEDKVTTKEIKEILAELQVKHEENPLVLKELSSGFGFFVDKSLSPWVSRLWDEKPAKYTRSLLETLVIIAYRQPVTRADIEEIRGVVVSSQTIRTLLDREWVRQIGHRDVPGRPALYATTKRFLDYFGLKTLEDLPTLQEIQAIDAEKLNQLEIQHELDKVDPEQQANVAVESTDEDELLIVEEGLVDQDELEAVISEEV